MARYEPNFGGEPRPWWEVIVMVIVGAAYIGSMAWGLYLVGAYFLLPVAP